MRDTISGVYATPNRYKVVRVIDDVDKLVDFYTNGIGKFILTPSGQERFINTVNEIYDLADMPERKVPTMRLLSKPGEKRVYELVK